MRLVLPDLKLKMEAEREGIAAGITVAKMCGTSLLYNT